MSTPSSTCEQYMGETTFSRRWLPSSGLSQTHSGVYLLHGTGEHSGRYEALAQRLTAIGRVVGAHDHPGHGQSTGRRGSLLPQGTLAVQAALQIQRFADDTGHAPILFGHSLGGVLAAELVLAHKVPVAGLILSSPAFRPKMSLLNRVKLNVFRRLAPDKVVELAYRPELLTKDPEIINEARQDSLIHGYRSARLIDWLFESGNVCLERATSLPVDTLLLIASYDPVVSSAFMRRWVKRTPAGLVTVREYPNALHEILNEVPKTRNAALSDIETWVQARP